MKTSTKLIFSGQLLKKSMELISQLSTILKTIQSNTQEEMILSPTKSQSLLKMLLLTSQRTSLIQLFQLTLYTTTFLKSSKMYKNCTKKCRLFKSMVSISEDTGQTQLNARKEYNQVSTTLQIINSWSLTSNCMVKNSILG